MAQTEKEREELLKKMTSMLGQKLNKMLPEPLRFLVFLADDTTTAYVSNIPIEESVPMLVEFIERQIAASAGATSEDGDKRRN